MLNNLIRTTSRSRKIIGRGMGSGKGSHTVGRGQKGQKTRDKIGLTFEGTKVKKSLLKRLPVLRGKGRLKPLRNLSETVRLEELNKFKAGDKIDVNALKKSGLINKHAKKVKIVAGGKIEVSVNIAIPATKGAKKSIEKAGGKVVSEHE